MTSRCFIETVPIAWRGSCGSGSWSRKGNEVDVQGWRLRFSKVKKASALVKDDRRRMSFS